MKESWEVKTWNEVLEIRSGRNQKAVINGHGKYPILGSSGKVMGYADDYICEAGTTIIGRKGTINNPIFINKRFWNVDTAFGLHANEGLDKYYLHYFCLSFDFSKMDKGSGRPSLVKSDLLKINIPIPPLSEQQQIVAILDKAFAAIDQAKANVEQNIENAKELFQSKLNEIFSQQGEGWEEKKFQEVCVLQRGFDLPKRLRKKGKYDLVTSSGVKDTHDEYKVEPPGVVTGRSGSIGNVFYIENKFWPLNTALYIKDFKENNEKYVYYFLKSFDLSKYSSGSGVPTLNRNFVHNEIVLSTNNIEEQSSIVETLDFLANKSNELEALYINKLNSLEKLKKSILQKAFAGALTSPNGTIVAKDGSIPSVDAVTKQNPEKGGII